MSAFQSYNDVIRRLPELECVLPAMEKLTALCIDLYRRGGTLFLAGNGGSAADCEHIAGELLKGFKKRRPLSDEDKAAFAALGEAGADAAEKLQYGLPAVSLLSHPGLTTAFANDVDAELIYAQQLFALGKKNDILIGISTGGNARNIIQAMIAAKVRGMTTVLLTGNRHGKCEEFADITVAVPESETFRIQEYHLALYHAFCLEVEAAFFDK